jgi:lipopolysaccharide/colanic/teichoic acid biosynthesis glycosyltransferase
MVASSLEGTVPASVVAPSTELKQPTPGSYERFKRTADLLLGGFLLLLSAPVIGLAWVLVRLTSASPGFYQQSRIGRFGEPFVILKLRTMQHDCEAASGVRWATRNDARVTAIGRVLRKLHIDELPQFLNVLRGDMSLVGPRPERPEFVGPLAEAIPEYLGRLRVRPGLTGLAQVQLPPDSNIDSVRRKLVLDLCYIHSRGPWLDLRLLMATALYLGGLSYDAVRRAMRLPDPLVPTETSQSLIDTVIDTRTR